MHAWPELYFEGQGWVRFEPTPSVAVPPAWSVVAPNQPSAAPSTVAEPSASSSVQPSAQATQDHQSPSAVGVTTDEASRVRTWILLGVIGVVLLLLLLTPMVVRRLRRRSRLGPATDPYESIARAWLEVRDSWLDLGHGWPQGTPRQIAGVVGKQLPEGVAETSLSDVVTAVERSRYAQHLDDVDSFTRQVDEVITALDASRPWYRRLGHVLLPASLVYGVRQWWQRVTVRTMPEEIAEETIPAVSVEDDAFRPPVSTRSR
jgi:hypothetical protein